MRVLIVDDSSLVRMQLRKYFTDNFINVEIEDAINGIDALEKHRRFKPELIILDYILPPPDGLAVLKIISSVDTQVKIIVMTTLGNQKYISDKLIDSGALAVFAKPITREILLKMVSMVQKSIGTGENIEKIHVDELKEDMVSSQTICDERGAILVSNGVVLTNSIIKRLKNFDVSFIYIHDEDDKNDSNKVIAALREISDDIHVQSVINIKKNRDTIEDILASVSERSDVKMLLNKWSKDSLLLKHSLRTAILSLNMGLIKRYNQQKLTTLAIGALLHDCGMNDFIEHDMEHPIKGYAQIHNNQSMDIEIALVCLQHHERYNGNGFPYSFNKTQITELALLVAVVDYYDRFLIKCKDPRKAFLTTVEKKGNYFEPGMTDLFSSTLDWARFYGIS